jgi:hypothetical protein
MYFCLLLRLYSFLTKIDLDAPISVSTVLMPRSAEAYLECSRQGRHQDERASRGVRIYNSAITINSSFKTVIVTNILIKKKTKFLHGDCNKIYLQESVTYFTFLIFVLSSVLLTIKAAFNFQTR